MAADGRVNTTVDVVVIGAGLSGLTAARRLRQAGADVLVVEARERIGGRLTPQARPGGGRLERGGELLAPHMTAVVRLAAEVGLALAPLPESGGDVIRIVDGERRVERELFASDADAAAAYVAAAAALDALAAEVPVEAPWRAPRAREWDGMTLRQWYDEHVPSRPARAGLALEIEYAGGTPSELSLLYVLWTIRAMGGWERWSQSGTHRIPEGTSALVERVAADLADGLALGEPVRAVARHAAGVVTVRTERRDIAAGAVVAALAPQLCGRIEWSPPLPPSRDRLQDRYLQGHGVKLVAVYDRPWWREAGLSGMATGLTPLLLTVDASPPTGEGVLLGFVAVTGDVAASDALADERRARDTLLAQLVAYFGSAAAEPIEAYAFSWIGDHWSCGCAAGLPPGVLSTVGPALRPPVGPIVWAGAETGLPQNDWIEGAVSAGERAAREALAVLADR